MNKMDTGQARLRYLDGDFEVLQPGSHVVCAVSGQQIPLDALRYWSVDLAGGLCLARHRHKTHAGKRPGPEVNRRGFLATGVAFVSVPAFASDAIRFSVTGAMEQGSLAFGQAPPGSLAALDGRPLDVTSDGRFVSRGFCL